MRKLFIAFFSMIITIPSLTFANTQEQVSTTPSGLHFSQLEERIDAFMAENLG